MSSSVSQCVANRSQFSETGMRKVQSDSEFTLAIGQVTSGLVTCSNKLSTCQMFFTSILFPS